MFREKKKERKSKINLVSMYITNEKNTTKKK